MNITLKSFVLAPIAALATIGSAAAADIQLRGGVVNISHRDLAVTLDVVPEAQGDKVIDKACQSDPITLANSIEKLSLNLVESYDPFQLASDLGVLLQDQCSDVVGFGTAMIPNTSNYVGVYRCNHSYRRESPWCKEARQGQELPGQGLIAWITHYPSGKAGPGNIGLMRVLEDGIPVVNQTDFYYADGYDLTWPPASPWYLDAVQSSSTGGKWSNYGNEGFPCGPLPPQRTWVQPIFHGIAPVDEIKWGAIYISLTKD